MKKSQMIKLKTILLLVSFLFAIHLNAGEGDDALVIRDVLGARTTTDLTTGLRLEIELPTEGDIIAEKIVYTGSAVIHDREGGGYRLTRIITAGIVSHVLTADKAFDTPEYRVLLARINAESARLDEKFMQEGNSQNTGVLGDLIRNYDDISDLKNGLALFMRGSLNKELAFLIKAIKKDPLTSVTDSKILQLYTSLEQINKKLERYTNPALVTGVYDSLNAIYQNLNRILSGLEEQISNLDGSEYCILNQQIRKTQKLTTKFGALTNIAGINTSDLALHLFQIEKMLTIFKAEKLTVESKLKELLKIEHTPVIDPFKAEDKVTLTNIHKGFSLITMAIEHINKINAYSAHLGESSHALSFLNPTEHLAAIEAEPAHAPAHGGAGGGTELVLRKEDSTALALLGPTKLTPEMIQALKDKFTELGAEATKQLKTELLKATSENSFLDLFLQSVLKYITPVAE